MAELSSAWGLVGVRSRLRRFVPMDESCQCDSESGKTAGEAAAVPVPWWCSSWRVGWSLGSAWYPASLWPPPGETPAPGSWSLGASAAHTKVTPSVSTPHKVWIVHCKLMHYTPINTSRMIWVKIILHFCIQRNVIVLILQQTSMSHNLEDRKTLSNSTENTGEKGPSLLSRFRTEHLKFDISVQSDHLKLLYCLVSLQHTSSVTSLYRPVS